MQYPLSACWQIISRICPLAVDADFEVQVRASGAAGAAGEGNDVARLHRLADTCQELGAVTVQRGETVAVVDHHIVAIAASVVLGDRHCPAQRRTDRRTDGDSQVHAGVPFALAGEGIDAVPEFRGDTAFPI